MTERLPKCYYIPTTKTKDHKMKEIWCEYYDEVLAEFEEEHGRLPNKEEELEITKETDERASDHFCDFASCYRE